MFGILVFLYYKSRIYTNSQDSYIVFKRYNFLNIIKKIRHPLTSVKYDKYKHLEYGNNFLWPFIDKICYEDNKGIPVTIPITKRSIDFVDIKIYETDDIVLTIRFTSYFNCSNVDSFLKLTEDQILEVGNGFERIIKKMIMDTIKIKPFKGNYDIHQLINTLKEQKFDKENETKVTENPKKIIWTYINTVLQASSLSKLHISSSNTQIVSVNINMNSVVNF